MTQDRTKCHRFVKDIQNASHSSHCRNKQTNKQTMDLWTYFIYNLADRKTQDSIIAGEGQTTCGCGEKNTTIPKRRFKVHHPSAYAPVH